MGIQGKKIPDDEINSICAWHMRIGSFKGVARIFGRSKNTIKRVILDVQSGGDGHGNGRPQPRRPK